MNAELYNSEGCTSQFIATAAYVAGQVVIAPNGRLGVFAGLKSYAVGDLVTVYHEGLYKLTKAASVVLVAGQEIYWIPGSSTASFYAPGRIYAGVCEYDAAAGDATVLVNLNAPSRSVVDNRRGGAFTDTVVGSATAAALLGGGGKLNLIVTSEAEKASFVSEATLSILDHPVFEARVARVSASAAAVDMDWGLALADQATDFEAGTAYIAFHTDGGDNNIDAHSKDGAANVAITDTTVDQTDAAYNHFLIDCRDRTNCKLYIDGVRVLSGSTFALPASATTLKVILHTEKTTGTATAELRAEYMRCWTNSNA